MRAPPRHAVIHLPALSAEEALRLLRLLDRVHDAIWRAHGPAIELYAEHLAVQPSAHPPPPAAPDDEPF